MSHRLHSALIVAGAYSIGLSRLPKVLARAGCRVTVLGPARTLASKSRFVHHVVATGALPHELLEGLHAHLGARAEPYSLISLGDDDALLAAASVWNRPWVGDWFPVPRSAESVAVATNKLAFGQAMLAAELPYAPSFAAAELTAAADAAERLGYPVILKAGHGNLGAFVRRANTPSQLAAAFAELAPTGALQVQKFIDGQVGCTSLLYDRGRLVAFAPSFKAECFPGTTGASCARAFMSHPDMQSICEAVGRVTGIHGFCGLDWILDRDGRVHVIELNARAIPGYHFCKGAAGVDFSAALRSMLAGEHSANAQPRAGKIVYMFPQHLFRCASDRDWRGLLRYLPFAATRDIPWDDPALLFEPMKKKLGNMVRARFAREEKVSRPATRPAT